MQTQSTPAAPTAPTLDRGQILAQGPSSVYQGLVNQRDVLRQQLGSLENQRSTLNSEIQQGRVQGASRIGIEKRIAGIDDRIADLEKQIAGVDRQVSEVAAVPGAIQPPSNSQRSDPPEELIAMAMVLMAVILFPFAFAMARRVWKGTPAASSIPSELSARVARIEQAVDTSAVEIERIGEGQRFITKLLSEQKIRALPSNKNNE